MTKTFRDNCDINIAQQGSCELLFPNVHMQLDMYFFVPSICPCMHHNYGAISGIHACRNCVWPMILGTVLNTTCRGERVLVFIRFNATFQLLRLYYEKTCTCFSKDAESLRTFGCVLLVPSDCFYPSYYLNTRIAFYFVTECSDVAMFVYLFEEWHAATHS